MKIKYIVYVLLIIAFGFLVGYRIVKNKSNTGDSKNIGSGATSRTSRITVNAMEIKPQKFSNQLAVSGAIQANEEIQIKSQVAGLIRGIYFEEGARVSKGKLLLKIDNSELQAQLTQALARQDLTAESEKRARLLLDQKAISDREYEVANADFKFQQAQTNLIRAQLAKTFIHAPFNGTIGLRSVSLGEYISPDIIVANLVNTDPVKITFSIPEKYSGMVKTNTKISFTVSGSPNKYSAIVYAIEPSIEVATRTLQLRAKADNPKNELIPGAFVNVELPLYTIEDAILVPTEAIIPIQNGKKVFVAVKGKAKEVKIETLTRGERDILITSGLKAGDTVITTGVMSLKAETPVKVVMSKK